MRLPLYGMHLSAAIHVPDLCVMHEFQFKSTSFIPDNPLMESLLELQPCTLITNVAMTIRIKMAAMEDIKTRCPYDAWHNCLLIFIIINIIY